MSSSPDRSKILGEYFNSRGMSRFKASKKYENTERVFTPCAKVRGARPYNMGGRILHRATRGSRAQVLHGTAHHTCGGLKRGQLYQHKKTKRIVSLAKREAGLRAWANMSKETKAIFLANRFQKKNKKSSSNSSTGRYKLRKTARVNYKGM